MKCYIYYNLKVKIINSSICGAQGMIKVKVKLAFRTQACFSLIYRVFRGETSNLYKNCLFVPGWEGRWNFRQQSIDHKGLGTIPSRLSLYVGLEIRENPNLRTLTL